MSDKPAAEVQAEGEGKMTAEFLLIGIPMVVFVFALWVGMPLWMVLRHPDRDPRETPLP